MAHIFKKAALLFGVITLTCVSSLSAYPMGLDIIGPVQAPGSDSQAQAFDAFAPTVTSYIGDVNAVFNPQNTATTQVISDPSNIMSNSDATVRFYFVSNSAAYNNTLGFSPSGTIVPGSQSIIFSNASINGSQANPGDANAPYAALTLGNFTDLGTLKAGTPLTLFVASDAANGAPTGNAKGIFWNNAALNSDGLVHARMVQFLGTNYYLIGLEDLPASVSDKDYNDVFVVAEIIPVPEPMTYVLMALAAGFAIALKRKQAQAKLAK